MNNQTKNCSSNLMYCYGIIKNSENFDRLAEEVDKKEYFIYRKIFLLLENCRIVNENAYCLTAEIDSEENTYLLQDIQKKVFIKVIGRRKVETNWQVIGNLFITIIIYK